MSTTPVPMSHPATVNKNSDGTYTVRVQHTIEGASLSRIRQPGLR